MTILFVLLTFLVIMLVHHYSRREAQRSALLPGGSAAAFAPKTLPSSGLDIPAGYDFHLGHTWVCDQGQQTVRVGMDSFAAKLIGMIDSIDVVGLNSLVQQGQKIWSVTHKGVTVDMVAPVNGVVVAVNPAVQKNPSLLSGSPYKDGWICEIEARDLAADTRNLLRGGFVGPWMQYAESRLASILSGEAKVSEVTNILPFGKTGCAAAAALQPLAKEFFLT